jgi:hypothetical protein
MPSKLLTFVLIVSTRLRPVSRTAQRDMILLEKLQKLLRLDKRAKIVVSY